MCPDNLSLERARDATRRRMPCCPIAGRAKMDDAVAPADQAVDTFIVRFWSAAIGALGWVSPLRLLWLLHPRLETHRCVDVWVLMNMVGAGVVLLVSTRLLHPLLLAVVGGYGVVRILEIVAYQAKIVFLDPYREAPITRAFALRSYRRIVVLALHNYFEIVLWFAGFYATWRDQFGPTSRVLASEMAAVYYSMVTMTTVGYGEITPASDFARGMVTAHLCIGLFMSVLILARFVSYLPAPRTMDSAEER